MQTGTCASMCGEIFGHNWWEILAFPSPTTVTSCDLSGFFFIDVRYIYCIDSS